MPSSAQAKFKRFRILVVGEQMQARPPFFGKSTVPQESPRSSMVKGNKVDPLSTQHRYYLLINHDQMNADVVKPSADVCTYTRTHFPRNIGITY
jgi:hypothetical protein